METIKKEIQELVRHLNVKVIGVAWINESGNRVLEVVIDSDEGVNMELCAMVTASIDDYIDKTITAENYYLNVCSKGTEEILSDITALDNNLGKYVMVNFKEAQEGIIDFKGYLGKKLNRYFVTGFIKGKEKTLEFDYSAVNKIQLTVKI